MTTRNDSEPIERLFDEPALADAMQSGRFKRFLDHIPVAVAVAELRPSERIAYVNLEFERLTAQPAAEIEGKPWSTVDAIAAAEGDARRLGDAIAGDEDYIGEFAIAQADGDLRVDAWSNIIADDDGAPMFRLVAIAKARRRDSAEPTDLEQRIDKTETLLRELQHRVKNNLQMITALVRLEARNFTDSATGAHFDRLAGRVESLALLYRLLSQDDRGGNVDLGVYLSQVASAVMQAQAVEGIRLDLKVDSWMVAVDVAMPTGLIVNELLTNALKHAFVGRESGTITLHSLVDDERCHLTVADDGVGFAEAAVWPGPNKLGALIVQSLRQNATARIDVASSPGEGVRVKIFLARASTAPQARQPRAARLPAAN